MCISVWQHHNDQQNSIREVWATTVPVTKVHRCGGNSFFLFCWRQLMYRSEPLLRSPNGLYIKSQLLVITITFEMSWSKCGDAFDLFKWKYLEKCWDKDNVYMQGRFRYIQQIPFYAPTPRITYLRHKTGLLAWIIIDGIFSTISLLHIALLC